MDFFYTGSTAINYWALKYYNKKFKEASDIDISSTELSFSELEQKYPNYDKRPQNGMYRLNCQAAIWRKDKLYEYIINVYSQEWSFGYVL